MKVLSLGTDEQVFQTGSVVRMRQEAYARALGYMELVVLTRSSHPIQQDGTLVLRAAAGSSVARLFAAYRLMRKSTEPDVITMQDPFEIGLVGYFAARHHHVPLHVQVHTDFLSKEFSRRSFLNRVRVLIAGFVLKRATRIRVVSERIRTDIERTYRPHAPITVLPIFVDVQSMRGAQPTDEPPAKFAAFGTKLLVVARLEPEKNVELAIRAFGEVAQRYPNACLIVVGEGSARKRLEALSRALHLEDKVLFEGAADSAPYYPLADLVLVPSLYEGYGLVIVEALAAGKPVLATDVGIAREAGAIVSNQRDFSADLGRWFQNGPREAKLVHYPYNNFDEYVRAYCADIEACTKSK